MNREPDKSGSWSLLAISGIMMVWTARFISWRRAYRCRDVSRRSKGLDYWRRGCITWCGVSCTFGSPQMEKLQG